MDGETRHLRAKLACHCQLVETRSGLVLIDTGFGLRDVAAPRRRLSKFFLSLLSPDFREEMTAIRQIERLGYDPLDVRHIVLSHLDFDHAGGLDDFPHATVHLLEVERETAVARKTALDKMRYRPQQWSTRARWRVYRGGEGEPWFGFDAVRNLEGVSDDILMVPLIGHTWGHSGIAINRGDRWLFNTADAYFFHGEMDLEKPHCTPGLAFYQRMMQKDAKARLWNQERLRGLKRSHSDAITLFSSHDVLEFERLANRPLDIPAEAVGREEAAEVMNPSPS